MSRVSRFVPVMFAMLLVSTGVSAQPAEPAGQATVVKVALLDMSSIAGPAMAPGGGGMMGGFGRGGMGPNMGPGGPGPGGGMGSGMMGPGMGPGTMGPGWQWGGGQGPGWMAQHMMGPGMMGMGMMSIRATKATAKPGKIRFEVANYSASILHEMEVVAVDDVNAPLSYDYNRAKVVVDKAREKGEVEDIAPGAEKVLEVTLPAGHYLLICNLPGHYAAGMVMPFTVAK